MNKYEKALDKACEYIHNDGVDGCPNSYDSSLIDDKKEKECLFCDYNLVMADDFRNEKYKEKSCKCWKEVFMKDEQ